jgi:predicted DNA-binding transcriptional regulator YafY
VDGPATRAPREEGFSKDADKLIRRLSLVALLLSRHGQPVSTAEIRRQVEGYPLMTDDAFKRRFYEDRAELAALRVDIRSEPDAESAGELYSLPASGYYLPAVWLSREEVTALAACLLVLEDRFAYSKPLRLALVSLAQGRPELLQHEPAPPVAVLPEADALRGASQLPKLQAAIADFKTVTFAYYAIGRDEEMERTVDPYGLQLVGDEWYLIGYCHLRENIRTFRLSRIRSRIRHTTRAPHDFTVPADFSLSAYRDRPAWQLGAPQATAEIAIDESMAWWVEAHFSHCGTITPSAANPGETIDAETGAGKSAGGEAHSGAGKSTGGEADSGAIRFATPYAAARPLVAWALGLGAAATIVGPAELRDAVATELRTVLDRLAAPPELAVARPETRTAAPARPEPADWHVEVDRFTRLTALGSYLLQHCGSAGEAELKTNDVCTALNIDAETLTADVRLLRLVNFGGDGALMWAEFKGDALLVTCDLAGSALAAPARLSPLQADTLLLAIELVGGQLPVESGAALAGAAAKLRSARRAAPSTLAADDLLTAQTEVLDAVNASIKQRHLLAIEYWSEGADRTSTRLVEPYLLVRSRGEWYFVCYCRRSRGTRVFRVATTKKATVRREQFEPRDDLELELYRREGIPTSTRYAPKSARLWYSPAVSRWIAERQSVTALTDGACVAAQPYMDEAWLVHYLLRFGGEDLPLEPAVAVERLRLAAEALLTRYTSRQ